MQVIMGGGRRELTPVTVRDIESNQPGRRMDGKNLIQTWLKTKKNQKAAKYVWNKQQLFNVNVSETDYLLGKLIQNYGGHMHTTTKNLLTIAFAY